MKYLMVITLSIASILSAAADNLKYAPHNFSVLPPSPEVESLNRYIDFGASLASGQPDINLPIYEVSHGSLSVPISIGYHGGGIKVNEKAGIVGLGWTLLAGATISRTVNGLPDEMLAEGGMMRGLFNITSDGKKLRNYVCNKPKEYDYAVANSDYVKYISRYCQPYEENRLDVANDVLQIAGMGMTGTFIYDDNRQMVLQSPSYLHFENGRTLNSNYYPGRYEIVDDKGTRYYFEATEYSEYSYLYYYRMLQNADMQKDKYRFISAWHLTKIKSLQDDSIMFEYQNMGERIYRVGGTYRYEDCFNSDYIKELVQGYTGADSYIDYYPKLLKRIVSSSEIVEFSYETTTVDVDTRTSQYDRLSKITIFRNDSECTPVKNFVFEQSESPFRGKRGGLLNKISEVSADGKNKQTLFSFDYKKGSVPNNYSKSQDHWGYYNGCNNASLLTKQFEHKLGSYPYGDREPNAAYAAIGILNKITYPTGGHTAFEWEPHDYAFVNAKKNEEKTITTTTPHNYTLCGRKHGEVLEAAITVSSPTNIYVDVSNYFEMFKGMGYLQGDDGWKDYNHSHSTAYSNDYPSVKIYNGKNEVIATVFIDSENSARKQIISISLPGQYRIRLCNPRNISLDVLRNYFERDNSEGNFGIVKINFNDITATTISPTKLWGGLRIRSITSCTNDVTNAKIRKTYKYATDYTKDNTSSGVVPFEPEYAYHFIMGGHVDGGMGDDLETVYGTSSYGLPTTATGTADILYSRVFETDEHNDDKIITQYDFSTYIDCPDHLDMAFSNCGSTNNRIYTSYAHKRGDLVCKTVFNTIGNNQQKRYAYEYEVLEGDGGNFTGDFVKISDFSNLMLKEPEDLIADYTVSEYKLIPFVKRLVKTNVSSTSEWDSVSKQEYGCSYFSTSFSDDSNFCRLKKSDWTFDSKGRRQETFYTYLNPRYAIIDSEVTVCDGKITAARRMEYDEAGRLVRSFVGESGADVVPKYELGKSAHINEDLKNFINIPEYEYLYESNGNIAQISYNGIVLASYLWGYNGKYPIVEALNTDFATLSRIAESAGFSSAGISLIYDDKSLTSLFNSIRENLPEAKITTLKYHWLTGIAEKTDSDGTSTFFSYDKFGRLDGIKDFNEFFIKKFEYKYRLK